MYKQVIPSLIAVSALAACSGEVVEPTPSGTPMQKEINLICATHGEVSVIYSQDAVDMKVAGRTLHLERVESPVAKRYVDGDDVLMETQGNFLLELDGADADLCRLADF